jgi:hypothetical protein
MRMMRTATAQPESKNTFTHSRCGKVTATVNRNGIDKTIARPADMAAARNSFSSRDPTAKDANIPKMIKPGMNMEQPFLRQ